VVFVAALFIVVTACSAGTGSNGRSSTVPGSASAATLPAVQVVLRFDDRAVGIRLTDTAASRELAARLPLRLQLRDAWGQAKTGRLSYPLTLDGAARTRNPLPGGVYYWPDTAAVAIYYDDLGQSVPPPGLIRLGTVVTGLDSIVDGGRLEARAALAPEFR
jgi:hypothetical protein